MGGTCSALETVTRPHARRDVEVLSGRNYAVGRLGRSAELAQERKDLRTTAAVLRRLLAAPGWAPRHAARVPEGGAIIAECDRPDWH